MKSKRIVSTLLLSFVVLCVAWLMLKEFVPSLASGSQEAKAPAVSKGATLVVYYFHGNMRCTKCRLFEAYTKDVMSSSFADAQKAGRLQWKVINIEDAGNEHYVQDFQLTTRTIILEQLVDGKRVKWKNLDLIWDLVGDEAAFKDYIKKETTLLLEAKPQ